MLVCECLELWGLALLRRTAEEKEGLSVHLQASQDVYREVNGAFR